MEPLLRERLERLGPIRRIDRVTSGLPFEFTMTRSNTGTVPRTIDAILILAKRGLTMLQAKRAIEDVIDLGTVTVTLPMVEDADTVTAELAAAGFCPAYLALSIFEPLQDATPS